MSLYTFLKEVQSAGANKLELFNKYSSKAAITDFAILLGGHVSKSYTASDGNSLEYRCGHYWTTSIEINNEVRVIHESGFSVLEKSSNKKIGIRPVLTNIQGSYIETINNEIREISYGEYPQRIVSNELSNKLEDIYKSKELGEVYSKLIETGRSYSTFKYENEVLTLVNYEEYLYDGKYYIRMISNSDGNLLSNGKKTEKDKAYWVEVLPIRWLVDDDTGIIVSKNILSAGLTYQDAKNKFIDKYFAKEIIERRNNMSNESKVTSTIKKKNPYDFNLAEVSEEEIIQNAINSDVPVFLHGKSSEGKSARVKQIDPGCIIIYLRNMTPERLNGKSVYNALTGDMMDVPPTWYNKMVEKCQNEPDKLHILFFDELTNALPSIQGMAFNIILDKEVNGIWKLPDNCRVVAAGNDLKDSLAANLMAEPLFNRFAHVYIETTVEKWLIWARENNIHPAIRTYITYKSFMGDEVLRSEFNGIKPNADPRRWEMASKMLYKSKNPASLRSLIGEEICRDFIEFCKQEVITVSDVINNNYTKEDLNMNVSQKFATAVGLSSVGENNFKIVRDFVALLGNEILAVFDTLWINDSEERMMIVANLKLEENKKKGR